MISPTHPDLSRVDRLAAETPRQIANAHTIVIIANTLLFIGLSTQLARLVEWTTPDKPFEAEILSVTARTSNRNCWGHCVGQLTGPGVDGHETVMIAS
jgi:phosphate:Na+ symporter